jgi:hypothetical protein
MQSLLVFIYFPIQFLFKIFLKVFFLHFLIYLNKTFYYYKKFACIIHFQLFFFRFNKYNKNNYQLIKFTFSFIFFIITGNIKEVYRKFTNFFVSSLFLFSK